MRRLIWLASRLYPAAWRARYGGEFAALLEQVSPGVGLILNVAAGGVRTRLSSHASSIRFAVLFGAIGVVVAACVAFATSRSVESTGRMRMSRGGSNPVVDPQRVGDSDTALLRLAARAFDDRKLGAVFERRDVRTALHRDVASGTERHADAPRGRVRVQLEPPNVIQVSFAADDAKQAQDVTADLMALLAESADAASGITLEVLDAPGAARPARNPGRTTRAGFWGLSAGAALGVAVATARKRRSNPQHNTHS